MAPHPGPGTQLPACAGAPSTPSPSSGPAPQRVRSSAFSAGLAGSARLAAKHPISAFEPDSSTAQLTLQGPDLTAQRQNLGILLPTAHNQPSPSRAGPATRRHAKPTLTSTNDILGTNNADDEAPAHISPAHSENVNFFGIIDVDVEGELAKLDSAGYRPLRDVCPEQ